MKPQVLSLINSIWDAHKNDFAQKPVEIDDSYRSRLSTSLYSPGPSYYFILEFSTRNFSYVSPRLFKTLKLNTNNISLEEYLNRVHPDDLPFVLKCERKIADFLFGKKKSEQTDKVKFAYCYRLKDGADKYRMILHQSMVISKDGFGRISKILGMDTLIDHLTSRNNFQLSIISGEENPTFLNIDALEEKGGSGNSKKRQFTKRELQIVQLFSKGYTAEEIGKELGISTGTIRTHRQNVLYKSSCKNMTELVATCIRTGIL